MNTNLARNIKQVVVKKLIAQTMEEGTDQRDNTLVETLLEENYKELDL